MGLQLSKEVKIAFFSVLSGVVLYVGFNFLKGSDMLSDSTKIHAVFTDVAGLTVSNPVLVNGLSVGRVKELRLVGDTKRAVLATFEIDDKNLILRQGTQALLISDGLLGGKAVRLEVPLQGSTLLKDNDTIPGLVEGGITEELTAKAAPMLANLDTVSTEIKKLLRSFEGTSQALEKTMASFAATSNTTNTLLQANQANIGAITGNAAKLTNQLVDTQKDLDVLVQKFNRFGDSLNRVRLAATVENLNKTVAGLNGVLKDVNAGKGSLGKLTKNDSLYTNLNRSSEALDALLKDMKARPGRYIHFSVFGKKDKP